MVSHILCRVIHTGSDTEIDFMYSEASIQIQCIICLDLFGSVVLDSHGKILKVLLGF